MKNMRKLTALLLAVVMVLSLSIAVFARDGGTITSATINGETATISTTAPRPMKNVQKIRSFRAV